MSSVPCSAATAELQTPVVNMVKIHDVFLNRASDPAFVMPDARGQSHPGRSVWVAFEHCALLSVHDVVKDIVAQHDGDESRPAALSEVERIGLCQ